MIDKIERENIDKHAQKNRITGIVKIIGAAAKNKLLDPRVAQMPIKTTMGELQKALRAFNVVELRHYTAAPPDYPRGKTGNGSNAYPQELRNKLLNDAKLNVRDGVLISPINYSLLARKYSINRVTARRWCKEAGI